VKNTMKRLLLLVVLCGTSGVLRAMPSVTFGSNPAHTNGSSGGGGGMAIGDPVAACLPYSALFCDAAGNLAQENPGFTYNPVGEDFSISVNAGADNILRVSPGGVEVNRSAGNYDFFVNGAAVPNLLLCSASTNTVSVAGNTVLGDDSTDTITSNAAVWSFPNDTAVSLGGGVNGINFDSNTLSIDALNNRVGIGTATPGSTVDTKLHVVGVGTGTLGRTDLRVQNTQADSAARITLLSGSSKAVSFQASGATYVGGEFGSMETSAGLDLRLYADSDNPTGGTASMMFYVGGWQSTNERMRILPTGKVGIGTTSPGALLDVNGAATVRGNTTLGDASVDSVTSNAASWSFPNDTAVSLGGGVNGINFDSNTLSIDATNNRVGIGTATPIVPLDVAGDVLLGHGSDLIAVAGWFTENMVDNIASVVSFLEGANKYLEIDTLDGEERIVFGAIPDIVIKNTQVLTTCTLDGASPSTCTATVRSGAQCFISVVGTAATASNCTVNTVGTTVTVTCANGLTNVVNLFCPAPN